jgi:plastocyanin
MVIATSMVLGAVACGGGAEDQGGGGGGGATVQLVAKDISFDTDEITLAAGAEATIQLDNQDEGLPHNVAIYEDESAETVIFQGDIVDGPGTAEYTFTAPDAGTFFFRCDVHPTQMTGTVVVE